MAPCVDNRHAVPPKFILTCSIRDRHTRSCSFAYDRTAPFHSAAHFTRMPKRRQRSPAPRSFLSSRKLVSLWRKRRTRVRKQAAGNGYRQSLGMPDGWCLTFQGPGAPLTMELPRHDGTQQFIVPRGAGVLQWQGTWNDERLTCVIAAHSLAEPLRAYLNNADLPASSLTRFRTRISSLAESAYTIETPSGAHRWTWTEQVGGGSPQIVLDTQSLLQTHQRWTLTHVEMRRDIDLVHRTDSLQMRKSEKECGSSTDEPESVSEEDAGCVQLTLDGQEHLLNTITTYLEG